MADVRLSADYHRGDITREVLWHGVYFTGTPEALEAAGLWARDALPGAPGCNKRMVTKNLGGDRKIQVSRASARRFSVYLSIEELHHRHPGFPEFMALVLTPVEDA